jgi:hypothetical protein
MDKTFKSILKWTIILTLDFIVFMFLSLLLMDYDDFYEESKGEYGSFNSMTPFQKGAEICFRIWIVLNLILLFLILKKIWRGYK